MADIFHHFPINAPAEKVFAAISAPTGLDAWWTLTSTGESVIGSMYKLGFGPGYDWQARVTKCQGNREFELTLVDAQEDWLDTRVGFELEERGDTIWVKFYHRGWPQDNEHYRTSCYCWAMYLRLLKRYVENDETVAYEARLDA